MPGNRTDQCFRDDSFDEELKNLVLSCFRDVMSKISDMKITKSDSPTLPFPAESAVDAHVYTDLDNILKLAETDYRNRRFRSRFFDSQHIFGEPAWDMLLDLFINELNGRKLSVTAVCIGSGVPPTTALRWIKVLEDGDLVSREVDERDGRRSFVRINQNGMRKMISYFLKRPRA